MFDVSCSAASYVRFRLPDGTAIRHVAAPAFVATKLEAFAERGQGDYALSHDIEDIIAVIDGRPEFAGEVMEADQPARNFISISFSKFMERQDFLDAVAMHLYPDEGSQARKGIILSRIRDIANIVNN